MRRTRTPDPERVTRRTLRAPLRRLGRRTGAGVAITASAGLAAALVGVPGAWAASGTQTPSAPAAHISATTGNINGLVDTVVSSTNASNGDTNPYDLAVVPFSSGMLVAGDVLVADFNNAAGTSGAGMSIVEVNPHTGTSTTFYQNAAITGPVGIAINPANDIVWVGFYGGPDSANSNAYDGANSGIAIINPAGTLVKSLSGSDFVGVWGQAVSDVGGQVQFYWPNAGNGVTGLSGATDTAGKEGQVWRVDPAASFANTPLATGLAATPAGTNSASSLPANPTGPRGMVFDQNNDTLYFTDDANNTIYAIPNANSATGASTPMTVLSGGPLSSPQQITVDPANGDLLVVNGATNNDLIELTTAGQVVATRDLAPTEPAGGLFGLTATVNSEGRTVIYYDNANDSNLHMLTVPNKGYWLVAKDGGVFSFGDAPFFGSAGNLHLNAPIVGMAQTSDRLGYWLVGADGGVFTYGNAGFYGSTGGMHLNAPIVAILPTPDGGGYWLVAADGGVFSFGDATFYGSLGGMHLNAPIVGGRVAPGGTGYWLVGADGGVFSFGSATFYGSTGGMHLNAPIVGMVPTSTGMGYWLVASDGGVFSFGDATFYGSEGGTHLNAPVVGIIRTPSGMGYWLVAADGGVFSFGDATFYGSEGGMHLNAPVVGGRLG